MSSPHWGTIPFGGRFNRAVEQTQQYALLGSHWDEDQRVFFTGIKESPVEDTFDVSFRAARACLWVTIHIQTDATGGRDYNAATFVSSTRYDMRIDRVRSVEVVTDGISNYFVWAIPEFEQTADGSFYKFDGVEADDHMAYFEFDAANPAIVASSLTSPYVPYASAADTLSDSGFQYDLANNRLLAPSGLLANPAYSFLDDPSTGLFNQAAVGPTVTGLNFEVRTGTPTTSPRIRVDQNGRVGIGTTSPADLLHIEDTEAVVSTTQLTLEGRWAGYGAGIDFVSRTSSGGTRLSMAKITADGESSWDTTPANQNAGLRFFTTAAGSQVERVRMDFFGRVGIGTLSPVTRLHIGVKVADDDSYFYDTNSLQVVHQTPTSNTTLNDPQEVLLLARQGTAGEAYGAAASFRLSRYENTGPDASRTRLDLVLADTQFLNGSTTVLTARSDGKVGIGTTSPQRKLDVVTTVDDFGATFAATLAVGQWTGFSFGYREDNNQYRKAAIAFERTGAAAQGKIHFLNDSVGDTGNATLADARMTIISSGEVGIGTTEPSCALDVEISSGQALQVTGNVSGAYVSFIRDAGAATGYIGTANHLFTGGVVTDLGIRSEGNLAFRANSGGTAHMTLNTSGQLGIGTTGPGAKLDVALGSDTDSVRIQRFSATGRSQIALSTEAPAEQWRFGMTAAGGTDFAFFDGTQNQMTMERDGDIYFSPGGAERVRIDDVGNMRFYDGGYYSYVGNTGWSGTFYATSNLRYIGGGVNPNLNTSWRYAGAAGGSNTAGWAMLMRANGTESGQDISFFTVPTSTGAGATPATFTQRWQLTSAAIRGVDGSGATPAYSFLSDPDTGMVRLGADHLGLAANGAANYQLFDNSGQPQHYIYTNGTTTGLTVGYVNGTNNPRLFVANYESTNATYVQHSSSVGNGQFYMGIDGEENIRFYRDGGTKIRQPGIAANISGHSALLIENAVSQADSWFLFNGTGENYITSDTSGTVGTSARTVFRHYIAPSTYINDMTINTFLIDCASAVWVTNKNNDLQFQANSSGATDSPYMEFSQAATNRGYIQYVNGTGFRVGLRQTDRAFSVYDHTNTRNFFSCRGDAGQTSSSACQIYTYGASAGLGAIFTSHSEVAHALTQTVPTNVYFKLGNLTSTVGGAIMYAVSEDAAHNETLELHAYGGTATTAKSQNSAGLMSFYAAEHNGSGSLTAVAANGNGFAFKHLLAAGWVVSFLIDEDGDFHYDGVDGGSYDSWDDAHLVRAMSVTTSRDTIKSKWDDFVQYNERDLIDAGILGDTVANGGLVNGAQMQRLHSGAIWQLHSRIAELEETQQRLLNVIDRLEALNA